MNLSHDGTDHPLEIVLDDLSKDPEPLAQLLHEAIFPNIPWVHTTQEGVERMNDAADLVIAHLTGAAEIVANL